MPSSRISGIAPVSLRPAGNPLHCRSRRPVAAQSRPCHPQRPLPSRRAGGAAALGPNSGTPLYWLAFDPAVAPRVVAILALILAFDLVLWVFGRTGNFLFLLLWHGSSGSRWSPSSASPTCRGVKRGLATGIAMITFVVLTVLFFAAFGGLLVSQLAQLINQIPEPDRQAADWASDKLNKDIDPQAIAKQFNITTAQMASWA